MLPDARHRLLFSFFTTTKVAFDFQIPVMEMPTLFLDTSVNWYWVRGLENGLQPRGFLCFRRQGGRELMCLFRTDWISRSRKAEADGEGTRVAGWLLSDHKQVISFTRFPGMRLGKQPVWVTRGPLRVSSIATIVAIFHCLGLNLGSCLH